MPTTHLLARAVVFVEGHVLLVRADGQSHTFLPGGHVERNEGLQTCLHREMKEELGVQIDVHSYLGAVEHEWVRDDEPQYEVNHCFAVTIPSLTPGQRPRARERYLTFGWVPRKRDAMKEVGLQPAPLRRLLVSGAATTGSWWASTLQGEPRVRKSSPFDA